MENKFSSGDQCIRVGGKILKKDLQDTNRPPERILLPQEIKAKPVLLYEPIRQHA